MEIKVAQIAEMLSATIEGNPDQIINSVCKIEDGKAGGLTFLANPKYTHYIYDTEASAVLVNKDFIPEKTVKATLIRTENAYLAIAKLMEFYQQMRNKKPEISKYACISPTAKIGKNVYIGEFVSISDNVVIGDNVQIYPHVYIGDDARIDDNTILHSGVKVYRDCVIGKHCVVHAGTVIGADGFGFAKDDSGEFVKVPQIGNVVIEDYVEIGANTCIDRAMMGSTIIHKNVKLDNLIQIAHNVEIGEGSAFASQVGISGSAKVGKHCILAGQVGVAGHITIADDVIIGAQSGVSNSITEKKVVLGSPAIPVMEEKKLIIYRKKLPQLFKQVNDLEKRFME